MSRVRNLSTLATQTFLRRFPPKLTDDLLKLLLQDHYLVYWSAIWDGILWERHLLVRATSQREAILVAMANDEDSLVREVLAVHQEYNCFVPCIAELLTDEDFLKDDEDKPSVYRTIVIDIIRKFAKRPEALDELLHGVHVGNSRYVFSCSAVKLDVEEVTDMTTVSNLVNMSDEDYNKLREQDVKDGLGQDIMDDE